jgi:hypothetical protein
MKQDIENKSLLNVSLDSVDSQEPEDIPCLKLDLNAALQDQIDYWEVDPSWDNQVFHSAAQNVRPKKKGCISPQILIPAGADERPVCTRLVFISGEQTQIVVNKTQL